MPDPTPTQPEPIYHVVTFYVDEKRNVAVCGENDDHDDIKEGAGLVGNIRAAEFNVCMRPPLSTSAAAVDMGEMVVPDEPEVDADASVALVASQA